MLLNRSLLHIGTPNTELRTPLAPDHQQVGPRRRRKCGAVARAAPVAFGDVLLARPSRWRARRGFSVSTCAGDVGRSSRRGHLRTVRGASATSPGTASFFRCVLALPLLAPLALAERATGGRISPVQTAWAATAGALFAADALLWTQAIYEVGVGLSAVLVNTQVVMVPLLAVVIDRRRSVADSS